MTGAIMQPTFLPWMGYFDMMDQCEVFVFYDDVQLAKRSWQVRNKIKTPSGELFLTIPIKKTKHRDDLLISEAKMNKEENWRIKHLKSIANAYRKAPHFEETYNLVEQHYQENIEKLGMFNIVLIKKIAQKIGIKTTMVIASDIDNIEGKKDTRLTNICLALGIDKYISPQGSAGYIEAKNEGGKLGKEGIKVFYHIYQHPLYLQQYKDFLPYMGIIDLLFNVGFKNALDIIRAGRKDLISSSSYRNTFMKKNI